MNLKKLGRYLRVNLLGPGPRLIKKKNLPGRSLAEVEKRWSMLRCSDQPRFPYNTKRSYSSTD